MMTRGLYCSAPHKKAHAAKHANEVRDRVSHDVRRRATGDAFRSFDAPPFRIADRGPTPRQA